MSVFDVDLIEQIMDTIMVFILLQSFTVANTNGSQHSQILIKCQNGKRLFPYCELKFNIHVKFGKDPVMKVLQYKRTFMLL